MPCAGHEYWSPSVPIGDPLPHPCRDTPRNLGHHLEGPDPLGEGAAGLLVRIRRSRGEERELMELVAPVGPVWHPDPAQALMDGSN